MNLIGLVLTIVLMALISTVGYFYGGPAYTNSKSSAEIAKLQDDFGQLSSALRLASVQGVSLKPLSSQEDLISSGILVDVPKFNGNSYFFWGATRGNPEPNPDGSIDYAFIVMDGVSESLCSEVNYRTLGKAVFEKARRPMSPVEYYLLANDFEMSEDVPVSELGSMVCFEDASAEPDVNGNAIVNRYVMFAVDKKIIKNGINSIPR